MKKLSLLLAATAIVLLCACDGFGGKSNDTVRICDNCAGYGKYTCRNCNGNGGTYNADGTYTVCSSCARYGVVTCRKCNGKGVIPID